MTKLDEIQSSFSQKLDSSHSAHSRRLQEELDSLRRRLLHQAKPSLPSDIARRLEDQSGSLLGLVSGMPVQPLLDLGAADVLQELDSSFATMFDLGVYYDTALLAYPTVYCETLAEFFTPIIEGLDCSPQMRQAELQRMVAEAEENARKTGGGIYGVNLPGKGCYLNGWLVAYGSNIPACEAFREPVLLQHILSTAAHEKLGHGFLMAYSALGGVKANLGVVMAEIAARFGMHLADDPLSSLRRDQASLLFMVSQLLEEGWATWVETYMAANKLGFGRHPRHDLQEVVNAVRDLPQDLEERTELIEALLGSLHLLFGDEEPSLEALHRAVMVVEIIGTRLDGIIGSILGQPLRYAVGELLMVQAEANLGALCVPYAALIAGNVTLDPTRISLTDLSDLLQRDARLNPDTRMAAVSRLKLQTKNQVHEMAQLVEAKLSFSVPAALKQ